MKRFVVSVLCLFAVGATWPSTSEWGPGGTLNHASSPTYALPIPVLDSIRATVPAGEQRRVWTRLRNEALIEWGIPFTVTNAPDLPVTDDGWHPPAGTIALVRSEVYLGAGHTSQGIYLEDSQSGIVILSLDRGWAGWPDLQRSLIAHETGHAIGFGHPYADGETVTCRPTGYVMICGYHVTAEERLAAQAYYLGRG